MRYTPVFTIEIEHDYFSVSTPEVLRIIPTTATAKFLRGAGLIAKFYQNKLFVLVKHLDCLLYTSPSPRDQRGSRMPSSA